MPGNPQQFMLPMQQQMPPGHPSNMMYNQPQGSYMDRPFKCPFPGCMEAFPLEVDLQQHI